MTHSKGSINPLPFPCPGINITSKTPRYHLSERFGMNFIVQDLSVKATMLCHPAFLLTIMFLHGISHNCN